MKVKITGGSLKGRIIKYPSTKHTRPTMGVVKEAIFSMIGNVKNKRVLDLFSSAGALGIEAISRGARFVVFVDKSSKALKYLSENLKELEIKNKTWIVQQDVIRFLKKNKEKFDIIFADPPYRKGYIDKIGDLIAEALENQGIFIAETEREFIEKIFKGLKKIKERVYGDTKITIFTKNSSVSRDL